MSAVLAANGGLPSTSLRWPLSFTLAAALHVAGVFAALHWHTAPEPAPPPVVVTIERAPVRAVPPAPARTIRPRRQQHAVAPPIVPRALPARALPARAPNIDVPPPQQVAAVPHVDAPEPAITAPPNVEAPRIAEAASAPIVAPRATAVAAAPASNAVPTWQGVLLGRLERFKRYPSVAQFRRQQGVVYLRFSMDRRGNVVSAAIDRSSGFDALDAEALALIHRAEPLPPPPAEVPGDPIELVVPIQFSLNR